MIKKIIVVLLAVVLIFSFTACKKNSVTFVDNEGNVVETVEVSRFSNRSVEIPEAPVIEGMTFVGWYLQDGASTIKVDESYFENNRVKGEITIRACYIDNDVFRVSLVKDQGYLIIDGITSDIKDVVIPSELSYEYYGQISTYPVKRIGERAFSGNTNIVSVTIPESVVQIGNDAFSGCSNLQNVFVPATVTNAKDENGNYKNIGQNIFDGANSIVNVTAPTWIVDYCFTPEARQKLVEVNFNAGVQVNASMFKDATALKKVTLCDSIMSINGSAFMGATSLESIEIPASVEVIAQNAFVNCSSLTSMTVAEGNANYESNNSNCIVEVIDRGTLEEKKILIAGCSTTEIYNGIDSIGEYAFVGCNNLQTLNIPASVTAISEGAFYGCTSLAEITVDSANRTYTAIDNCLIIPYSMRLVQGCKNSIINETYDIDGEVKQILSISYDAFRGCTGIREVYIPGTVAELEIGAFDGCTSLNKIVIGNNGIKFPNPADLNSTVGDVFSNCAAIKEITVPASLLDYFVNKSKTTLENIVLTTGDGIKHSCFVGCSALSTVYLPATVTSISDFAFAGCEKLVSVTIPQDSNLAAIGCNAFDGCKSFKKIITDGAETDGFAVYAGVQSIGDYAFRGCSIEALSFAEDCAIRSIGYKVFADCRSLNSVTIPSYIEDVDFDAFTGCANLKEAHIPSAFIRVLSNAKDLDHAHCQKGDDGSWLCQSHYPAIEILDIICGDIVDSYYIREMRSLRTLIIGADITEIDNRAFEGCSNLAELIVANDNTVYYSCGDCIIEKATEALILGGVNSEIPEAVKTIVSYAFAQSAISKIEIPATVELVSKYAFSSCRSLATVIIKSDSTVIEDKAFDGSDKIITAEIPANFIPYISQVSLENVKITVGEIPANAFRNNSTLKTVTISTEVTSIGENAFDGCDNIIGVTAPASILLGFSELDLEILGINEVDVPITKEFINKFKNIKELYLLESDTEYSIEAYAFSSCTKLEKLNVPAWALSKLPLEKIKYLTVNSGSTVTGNLGFPALVEVSFGAGVTYVDASVFRFSSSLAAINISPDNSKYTVENGRFLLDGSTLILAALAEEEAEYDTSVLPVDVTVIGDYAFAGRENIGKINLHEGIISVGNHAFNGCATLEIDAFPATLQAIGNYAFSGCQSIAKISLGGIKTIGANAFASCTGATVIELSETLISIGNSAFANCNGVTEASVPAFAVKFMPVSIEALSVIAGDEIESGSIKGFNSLTTLTIGASVTDISSSAIQGTNNIMSVTVDSANEKYVSSGNCVISDDGHLVFGCNTSVIPCDGSVKYIDEYAFNGCEDLKSVVIPASVVEISLHAFNKCTAIKSLTVEADNTVYHSADNCIIKTATKELVIGCRTSVIPNDGSVTKIGEYAFANTLIKEVKLPACVTEIGASAFEGCVALTNFNVYLPAEGTDNMLAVIGAAAFKDCLELKGIILPGSVTTVANDSFKNVSSFTIYWYGTEAEYNAANLGIIARVLYYAESNTPGCWYYKDEVSVGLYQ